MWAPSLVNATEIPWRPGYAVWHRTWEVWVQVVAEMVYGETPPVDAILLTPENASDGTPDMAARLDKLERMIRQLGD